MKTFAFDMLGSAISIALCMLVLLLLVVVTKAGTLHSHLSASNNRQKSFTGKSFNEFGYFIQKPLHSEKSGAKTVPQRSRFGKQLLFGKEGPFFSS